MSELRHPPQCLQPFAASLLDRDEQARAKRAAGMAELASSPIQPSAKGAWKPFAIFVQLLLLRRKQGFSLGPVAKAGLQLLAGAVERAAGAIFGAAAEVAHKAQ